MGSTSSLCPPPVALLVAVTPRPGHTWRPLLCLCWAEDSQQQHGHWMCVCRWAVAAAALLCTAGGVLPCSGGGVPQALCAGCMAPSGSQAGVWDSCGVVQGLLNGRFQLLRRRPESGSCPVPWLSEHGWPWALSRPACSRPDPALLVWAQYVARRSQKQPLHHPMSFFAALPLCNGRLAAGCLVALVQSPSVAPLQGCVCVQVAAAEATPLFAAGCRTGSPSRHTQATSGTSRAL
jgi:hypothetical protein